jgi:hypothetical protein
MKTLTFALGLSLFALTGCAREEEEKCNQFLGYYCDALIRCTPGANSSVRQECIDELEKKRDCSKAVEVAPDFDKCEAGIKAQSCQQIKDPNVPFPSSCKIGFQG